MFGKIQYTKEGLVVCEECGKSFKRLMNHVVQKHEMSSLDYKKKHGLSKGIGILSEESKKKSSDAFNRNREKVISNILEGGKKTRYTEGNEGRTKDKLSEQERLRLIEHAKTNISHEKRKKLGKILGESGLGNKKRWGK